MRFEEITDKVKRKMCEVTEEGHRSYEKWKPYVGETISDTESYEIFKEKAGIFCKNDETKDIKYIPNYWETPFDVRDKKLCQKEEGDTIVQFHTHPIMLPKLSSGDLQVANYYYGRTTWSCLGAGDERQKRILCVLPTKEYDYEPWEELKEKLEKDKYEKILKKGYEKRITTKYSDTKYSDFEFFPPYLDQKDYRIKKKWILDSDFFDIEEFGCKNLQPIHTIHDKEFPKKFIDEKIQNTMEFLDEHTYVLEDIGDWQTIKSAQELHDRESDYGMEDENIYDIHGIVQMGNCEEESIETKDGKYIATAFRCILNIADETEDIDVNFVEVYPFRHEITQRILDNEIVGDIIRVNGARFKNELLIGNTNTMFLLAKNVGKL